MVLLSLLLFAFLLLFIASILDRLQVVLFGMRLIVFFGFWCRYIISLLLLWHFLSICQLLVLLLLLFFILTTTIHTFVNLFLVSCFHHELIRYAWFNFFMLNIWFTGLSYSRAPSCDNEKRVFMRILDFVVEREIRYFVMQIKLKNISQDKWHSLSGAKSYKNNKWKKYKKPMFVCFLLFTFLEKEFKLKPEENHSLSLK